MNKTIAQPVRLNEPDIKGIRQSLFPVDRVIFAYLAYIPLLVLFLGRPLADYSHIFVNNLIVAGALFLLVKYVPLNRHWLTDTLRLIYPALLFGYFYNQTGDLMRLVYPEFFDNWFTGWEAAVYGGNITLVLDHSFLGSSTEAFVTEFLSMCYFSYYLMFPALLIPLLVTRKRRLIQEYLTAAAITFFVSYNLFWLFPLEGPRWFFAGEYDHSMTGVFFRPLVDFVINNGAVRGGCMPSTHTGVALVTLVYLYRGYRKWFWISFPLVIGLAVGAVYGRFHYITDIIIGALIAAPCVWLTIRYYPRWINERS